MHLLNPTNGAIILTANDTITIVENDPNAVDNFDWKNTIDIFPNPVSQNLFIGQPVNYDEVKIINILGEVVKNVEITSDDFLKTNVADLNSGIYFILIKSGNEMVEKKFVKE